METNETKYISRWWHKHMEKGNSLTVSSIDCCLKLLYVYCRIKQISDYINDSRSQDFQSKRKILKSKKLSNNPILLIFNWKYQYELLFFLLLKNSALICPWQ